MSRANASLGRGASLGGPLLPLLQHFDAAARHRSFTRAAEELAEELNVTRPSRTWGVLCPGLGVVGRGRVAVADGAGGGRGRGRRGDARDRRRRASAGRALRGDAGPRLGAGQGGPGGGATPP